MGKRTPRRGDKVIAYGVYRNWMGCITDARRRQTVSVQYYLPDTRLGGLVEEPRKQLLWKKTHWVRAAD